MRIGSASYAVLEVITINDLAIPVLNIPIMEDVKRAKPNIPETMLKQSENLQMTRMQREIWRLYISGHTRPEIAKELGKSPGTIYVTIDRIIRKLNNQCVYSPSCFTCPMPDCAISGALVINTNRLLTD